MNNRQSPIHWSFSCGTWAGTDVRVSYFVPLVMIVIAFRLGDLQLGLAVSLIFLVSVLIHEAAHIFAVRSTGGTGDEILLWPLGGLASVYPANTFRSQFLTPAAGPISNVLICLVVLFPVLQSEFATAVFNPLVFPIPKGAAAEPFEMVLAITFWINYVLTLLNLIPVYPLDGGRMLLSVLNARMPGDRTTEIYLKVGCFIALIGMFVGVLADNTVILFVAAVVLVLNLQESYAMRATEQYEDNFLGYDFSQGYTSLERGHEEDRPAPAKKRAGFLKRWREKRRAEKDRIKREQDAEVQAELDRLLEKIQQEGMDSLTEAERRKLDRAAALFKEKERGQAEM